MSGRGVVCLPVFVGYPCCGVLSGCRCLDVVRCDFRLSVDGRGSVCLPVVCVWTWCGVMCFPVVCGCPWCGLLSGCRWMDVVMCVCLLSVAGRGLVRFPVVVGSCC